MSNCLQLIWHVIGPIPISLICFGHAQGLLVVVVFFCKIYFIDCSFFLLQSKTADSSLLTGQSGVKEIKFTFTMDNVRGRCFKWHFHFETDILHHRCFGTCIVSLSFHYSHAYTLSTQPALNVPFPFTGPQTHLKEICTLQSALF